MNACQGVPACMYRNKLTRKLRVPILYLDREIRFLFGLGACLSVIMSVCLSHWRWRARPTLSHSRAHTHTLSLSLMYAYACCFFFHSFLLCACVALTHQPMPTAENAFKTTPTNACMQVRKSEAQSTESYMNIVNAR